MTSQVCKMTASKTQPLSTKVPPKQNKIFNKIFYIITVWGNCSSQWLLSCKPIMMVGFCVLVKKNDWSSSWCFLLLLISNLKNHLSIVWNLPKTSFHVNILAKLSKRCRVKGRGDWIAPWSSFICNYFSGIVIDVLTIKPKPSYSYHTLHSLVGPSMIISIVLMIQTACHLTNPTTQLINHLLAPV